MDKRILQWQLALTVSGSASKPQGELTFKVGSRMVIMIDLIPYLTKATLCL